MTAEAIPGAHDELRNKLALAGKVLVAEGQNDFIRGHISARVPGKPGLFLMKPHLIGFDEITPENLLTIGLDGAVVAGTGRRHSETFIHSEIYSARPDVMAVLHTHPPYAVAFSATGRPMRALNQPSALFLDALGFYSDTINLIRSPELGEAVARALAGHRAVLLRNHGAVCVGASVEEVVITAIMLENAAMIQMVAEAAGADAPEFPRDDVAQLQHDISRPEQFAINFDYLVRRWRRRN